jgi:hypothetical protein
MRATWIFVLLLLAGCQSRGDSYEDFFRQCYESPICTTNWEPDE